MTKVKARIVGTTWACLILATAPPAAAGNWQYDASLYGWFTGLDGTVGLGRVGDVPVEASFSDLVQYVDFCAAVHIEARNPKVVLVTDVNYVNLGAERPAQVAQTTVDVDLDFKQWIVELGGGYRASENIELLVAGRYYAFDLGLTAATPSGQQTGSSEQNWGDLFLGARYSKELGQKWFVAIRGDVGAGGSNFAWFGNAAVGYRFSPLFSLGLGYRILSLNYETGSGSEYFKYDVTYDGLGMALRFSF